MDARRVSLRTLAAVIAELIVQLRRPALMASWALALLLGGLSIAIPVLEVLAHLGW